MLSRLSAGYLSGIQLSGRYILYNVGTSRQYITSKLFQNLLRKRKSSRKQSKINSFFCTV